MGILPDFPRDVVVTACQLLRDYGAGGDIPDSEGRTPLDLAIARRDECAARLEAARGPLPRLPPADSEESVLGNLVVGLGDSFAPATSCVDSLLLERLARELTSHNAVVAVLKSPPKKRATGSIVVRSRARASL